MESVSRFNRLRRAIPFNDPDNRAISDSQNRLFYAIQAIYLTIVFSMFMVMGTGVTPDMVFLFLVLGFTWRNRAAFIRDFGPFVLLLLSYDVLRGYADNLGGAPYITYPIRIDEAIFGEAPGVALQRWLFDLGNPHWYDYAASAVHIIHFIIPLFMAAIIWQHHRKHYWPFVMSLLVLSYAGFITYLFLPTAPPWFAANAGELPNLNLVHQSLPAVSALYHFISPNPVAAMPSLHAAYPWLFFLFGVRIWGWRGTPFLAYVALVDFSIMYLGHHYFIDVVAGVFYASIAYGLCATTLVGGRIAWLRRRFGPTRVEYLLPALAVTKSQEQEAA